MIYRNSQQFANPDYIQYDLEVARVVAKADNEDEWGSRSEASMNDRQEEEYEHQNDSLLHLILGVQHYLEERKALSALAYDSPLCRLQYRMHVYIREKALKQKPFS
ncbi:hypothetical protein A0J61_02171 [Choanephora cucurbitarum]|uniref:Uncharacterized protein n=1 Tax=Choanephora cucurbitarum TaxID=101091 RepID=A0A1C7NLB5_9FUNG|nr:hypothetical protein A0J61_02171 [Choanephora cucurbitarum]